MGGETSVAAPAWDSGSPGSQSLMAALVGAAIFTLGGGVSHHEGTS